ncbi:uncharacterized protein V1518DRAFT_417404 [Limtongia smithiae]|uniref:uncharacterized protein n=1 Tax=Limtongia smithiae TaxID=1125753 RepID=UPI0034CF9D6E
MAPTVAITGSASGIGAAIAKLYAGKGYNLVLADSSALLSKTTAALQALFPSTPILARETDVTQASELVALKDAALAKFPSLDVVVLNAGTSGNYKMPAEQGGWWGNPDAIRKLYDVNLFGVVNGIHAFLPTLREQAKTETKTTRIIVTGSKQGITNPPGNPVYNSSKAAIRLLAEQLSYELKDESVKVHLLVPGWTYTGLVGGEPGLYSEDVQGKTKPSGAWSPDEVANYLEAGIAKENFFIICPDNETSEEVDKIRMEWSCGDFVTPRLPLSRWRPEYKEEFAKFQAEKLGK